MNYLFSKFNSFVCIEGVPRCKSWGTLLKKNYYECGIQNFWLDEAEPEVHPQQFGHLHFYDASAPIVSADSIDLEKAFTGDRYGKGTGDYINCPMNKEEYTSLVINARAIAITGGSSDQMVA